jgi:hypothetical protein
VDFVDQAYVRRFLPDCGVLMSHLMVNVWHQWQREVTVNRQKAVLLAGLFLLGCCCWIPMLARAITPTRSTAAGSPGTASAPLPGSFVEDHGSPDLGTDRFWASLSNSLASDPLFQAADTNSLERDPFLIADSTEPLPVLFAEDYGSTEEVKVEPVVKELRPLRLTSTIISQSRRAAMINGELVVVGHEIQTNGHSYLLTKVESSRVVLRSGDEMIELKIARSRLKDVLDRRDADDLRE